MEGVYVLLSGPFESWRVSALQYERLRKKNTFTDSGTSIDGSLWRLDHHGGGPSKSKTSCCVCSCRITAATLEWDLFVAPPTKFAFGTLFPRLSLMLGNEQMRTSLFP